MEVSRCGHVRILGSAATQSHVADPIDRDIGTESLRQPTGCERIGT